MTAVFHPAILRRVKSAAALLASNQESERCAAWLAIDRLTGGNPAALLVPAIEALAKDAPTFFNERGLTATDLSRSWQQSARLIAASSLHLTAWERRFLNGMGNNRKPPTQKQADRLAAIASAFNDWRRAHG